MAIEGVVPGVYQVGMGYVNAFLIAAGEPVLVDSGLRGRAKTFLAALSAAGKRPEDLKHIAVTHHHVDHVGSLAALKQATGARSYVPALDAPIVTGERPAPGAQTLTGKVLEPLMNLLPASRREPAPVDHEVEDGEELPIAGGLRAVHTPGHTAGHTSYLWPEAGGVLFVGDAAGHLFGRLGLPLGMYTEDMAEARRSIAKIAALEFDVACFGHGGVLKGKAHADFRRKAEKLAK